MTLDLLDVVRAVRFPLRRCKSLQPVGGAHLDWKRAISKVEGPILAGVEH